MINREKTIFGHGMNQRNRQSVGGKGTAPCFSSFGVGAMAWCRDGGGMGREVELRDPLVRKGDGVPQCLPARRTPQLFCAGFRVQGNVPMSLNGRSHHGLGS